MPEELEPQATETVQLTPPSEQGDGFDVGMDDLADALSSGSTDEFSARRNPTPAPEAPPATDAAPKPAETAPEAPKAPEGAAEGEEPTVSMSAAEYKELLARIEASTSLGGEEPAQNAAPTEPAKAPELAQAAPVPATATAPSVPELTDEDFERITVDKNAFLKFQADRDARLLASVREQTLRREPEQAMQNVFPLVQASMDLAAFSAENPDFKETLEAMPKTVFRAMAEVRRDNPTMPNKEVLVEAKKKVAWALRIRDAAAASKKVSAIPAAGTRPEFAPDNKGGGASQRTTSPTGQKAPKTGVDDLSEAIEGLNNRY